MKTREELKSAIETLLNDFGGPLPIIYELGVACEETHPEDSERILDLVKGLDVELSDESVRDYCEEDNLSDVEADAMTLAGAGMGTDEDYGCFGCGDEY